MVALQWNVDFLCPSTLPHWRGILLFLTLFMCPVIYIPQWWSMVLLHVLFTFSCQLHWLTGILVFLLFLLFISSAQRPRSIDGVWLLLFCLVTSLCRHVSVPLPCLIHVPCPLTASLMEYGSFYNPWSHPLAGHITAWMCMVPLYLFSPFSCPVQLHPLPQWTRAPLTCSYQLPSCTSSLLKGSFTWILLFITPFTSFAPSHHFTDGVELLFIILFELPVWLDIPFHHWCGAPHLGPAYTGRGRLGWWQF